MGGLRLLARDLRDFDRRAAAILVLAPLVLTAHEYLFVPASYPRFPEAVAALLRGLARAHPELPAQLWRQLWWGLGCVLLYIVVPSAVLRPLAGLRPRDLGLRVRGLGREAGTYALLFLLLAPLILLVSRRPDFQRTYPLYQPAGALGADFLAFEAVYFLQFLGVEYFFRGVLTLGLKPRLGRASILVMLAPYCMLHYHKPPLEALASIVAGLVLGCLSWRTGTVVWGWLLHYAVALSMDLLALGAAGRLAF